MWRSDGTLQQEQIVLFELLELGLLFFHFYGLILVSGEKLIEVAELRLVLFHFLPLILEVHILLLNPHLVLVCLLSIGLVQCLE